LVWNSAIRRRNPQFVAGPKRKVKQNHAHIGLSSSDLIAIHADCLLRDHEVPPLTEDQERELDAIMEEGDRMLEEQMIPVVGIPAKDLDLIHERY